MNKVPINTPISKILIANRGEIACRIIHSAKKLGIKTVAVYSSADTKAKHVGLADEAFYIGEAPAKDSYLQSQRIIDVALQTNAQAIHPGYGFLSENAAFSQLCSDNNLIFIGPPAQAINAMGLKSEAKVRMEAAKVPLVPGYHGDDQSIERLKQACIDIGFPVLLKASAGGGGKGMRVVESLDGIEEAIAAAQRESLNSFSDSHLLAEKYLKNPRHIEIQLFCDQYGNGVYLFERDCSIQRRHQKIVEEAPAPNFPDHIRKAMGEAALQAASAIDYVGAGTVEFLYENGEFYFMEMNTRLQVEHPVSEYITGQDLVAWQIKIASGEPLPVCQEDLAINGHAIEVRLYAEDPNNNFLPTAGKIDQFIYPTESTHFSLDYDKGIRMDTGVADGDEVSPFYDPMIAKLIVWAEDRQGAINKLKQALQQTHITGLTTNVRYLEQLISLPSFADAGIETDVKHSSLKQEGFDTGFIEKNAKAIAEASILSEHDQRLHQIFCAYYLFQQRQYTNSDPSTDNRIQSNDHHSPWNSALGWRLNAGYEDPLKFHLAESDPSVELTLTAQFQPLPSGKQLLLMDGQQYQIEDLTDSTSDNETQTLSLHIKSIHIKGINIETKALDCHIKAQVLKHNKHIQVHNNAGTSLFIPLPRLSHHHTEEENEQGLHAPMNGCLTEVKVSAGDTVNSGDILVIMEAMKMEHIIKAPHNGIIDQVFFVQGDLVDEGSELLSYE
ncbi:MAG: ATP-grasp domain-containing protein [Oleispira sp.]|nr:ATP-grasp domain-containing protein [Oleispira sp.]MBL4882430.1 ATP-grasp domain-containing protein [Oleispira sp.]